MIYFFKPSVPSSFGKNKGKFSTHKKFMLFSLLYTLIPVFEFENSIHTDLFIIKMKRE